MTRLPVAHCPPGGDGASAARLARMFSDYAQLVRGVVRRFGLTEDAAEDAAQQVFLVAIERMHDIKEGSERAFLFGTALRIGRRAQQKRRRFVSVADMDVLSAPGATPEDLADCHRNVEVVDRTLGTVDGSLRTVFVLFELEGLTGAEIGARVGLPLGTIASRLRRARNALRAALPD